MVVLYFASLSTGLGIVMDYAMYLFSCFMAKSSLCEKSKIEVIVDLGIGQNSFRKDGEMVCTGHGFQALIQRSLHISFFF